MTRQMVMNNKIAVFSDLHLGVHQNSEYWLNIAIKWADWFVSEVKKKDIDTVLFCGDWMHHRDFIDVKTLHYHSLLFEKFNGLRMIMFPGNHCCYYKNDARIHSLSILKGRPNVEIYDKYTVLELGDRKISVCPWGTSIEEIEKCDVIFGHFELQHFKMNNFKVCDHGDDPELLINKAPLVFSGHFHKRDEKKFDCKGEIIYIGNTFQTDFGDAYQQKGFYVLDLDDLSYEFIENKKSPKHYKVFLSELIKSDPKGFFKTVKDNILKIVIDKNISTEHLDLLIAKINTYNPVDIKIDFDINYKKIAIDVKEDIDIEDFNISDVVREFVDMLDINNKEEVVRYTLSLYNDINV